MNGRLFNITNDNPEDILIVNIEHAEITINLEYITFINNVFYKNMCLNAVVLSMIHNI